jgi:Flp pilus assembly protein TadG
MHQKKLNHKHASGDTRKNRRRGQAMLESALVILVFFVMLIGIFDFGQIFFTQEMMTDRVRAAVRWGIVNPYDGTGDQLANMVMYNAPTTPGIGARSFLGLERSNVLVSYFPPTADNPNDERITVTIVNYQFRLMSPLIAHTFTNGYVASGTGTLFYKP